MFFNLKEPMIYHAFEESQIHKKREIDVREVQVKVPANYKGLSVLLLL